jgi:hypothetical protein
MNEVANQKKHINDRALSVQENALAMTSATAAMAKSGTSNYIVTKRLQSRALHESGEVRGKRKFANGR